MRLDKFLKVSRLIKRRTVAKEISDQGRISINGLQAKASSDVKVGDELAIRFGQKLVKVKINELKDMTKKEDADNMYTVLEENRIETTE
ncbi:RNA-binding S4 domain-containing protein [Fictibacillus nanhaiensis]|uniref:RNA-binding S4 domain-containing protein n=1 Tax=Fictibacillus nanhaiensis TaxID=742169 RepID=UPI003C16CBA5